MRNAKNSHREQSTVFWWTCSSPIGELLLLADAGGLTGLHFQNGLHPLTPHPAWQQSRKPFHEVLLQLKHYFSGSLRNFQVELSLRGTPFQLLVWHALRCIPYGTTASYGDIAAHIGNPKACRAVGAANGQNPISILVPCHRVIGRKGEMVGYGGGLAIKEALLDLEGRTSLPKS